MARVPEAWSLISQADGFEISCPCKWQGTWKTMTSSPDHRHCDILALKLCKEVFARAPVVSEVRQRPHLRLDVRSLFDMLHYLVGWFHGFMCMETSLMISTSYFRGAREGLGAGRSGGPGRDVAGGGGQGGGARPWSASGPWVSANSSRISCCAAAMPEPITCRARIRPMDHGK